MTRESIRLEGLPVQESVQYQEPKFTQEGLETVILKGDATYPLTITQSFGPEIVNPDVNVATALAYGVIQPTRKSDAPYAMLVGLQANGRCGADCKGCVFANHRVGEAMNDSNRTKKLARPVDPQTMSEVIAIGKQLISLEGDQTFRLNALLSGDPAYSPYVPALIDMVMRDPTFSASRWSTIAADTSHNPLHAFVNAAHTYYQTARVNPIVANHKLRFQVSLHSTDRDVRAAHVSHYRQGSRAVRLLETSEIADAFYCIKQLTGNKSTLSFVLHGESVIDPVVLSKEISPEVAMVCVRPIIPTDDDSTDPMPVEVFRRLYEGLQSHGYDVVVMPPIGLEMDNIHAGQFHRT